MNLPTFCADVSLQCKKALRFLSSDFGKISLGYSIAPAYFPGPDTQRDCSDCLGDVAKALVYCDAVAAVRRWRYVPQPVGLRSK